MKKHAATYVRMSTELQDYSIINQTAALERFAEANNMAIVKRFEDPGKSGLTIQGRPGLKELLLDVISTKAEFEHVLVYDVSRWGRFLDSDESAYYEYTCKKAGIKVHYCCEAFVNDGSIYANLIKSLKRIMAGEYSRELSAKVHAAQIRFAGMGFTQGGSAAYGIRRQLLDREGMVKGWLSPGDRKGLKSDRIRLSVGPKREADTVRQIFDWFVSDRFSTTKIAQLLNRRGIKPNHREKQAGRPEWTTQHVCRVLANPKYIGTIIYNRTSQKLHEGRVVNPAEKWVLRAGALDAIVDPSVFEMAQHLRQTRQITPDDDQVLERLAALLKKKGRLSMAIIDDDPDTPSAKAIIRRFKSLFVAYKLVGYSPRKDAEAIRKQQRARGRVNGFDCLGDAIIDAVAKGKLTETFTLNSLRAACPGWSRASYSPLCWHYTHRAQGSAKLEHIGTGEYRLVGSQSKLRKRIVTMDDSQVLKGLGRLLKKQGRLSREIISKDKSLPCPSVIVRRFGSLPAVYSLLGYTPTKDLKGIQKRLNERRTARGPGIMADEIRKAIQSGKLAQTFTVEGLRAACPGWASGTYGSLCSQYAGRRPGGAIKLLRVGPGVYRLVPY